MTYDDRPRSRKLTSLELSEVIRDVARLYDKPGVGSPEVSNALLRLSKVFRRYSRYDLDHLLDALGPVRADGSRAKKPPRKPDPSLSSLDLNEVPIKIREARSKEDLVDLANLRFGISRSRLVKERKEDIIQAINRATQNEETHGILTKEASREGGRRAK